MTELLYLHDCYLKEFTATITRTDGQKVILDRTAFFPTGGGQPCDQGKLFWEGKEANVTEVQKQGDEVVHIIEGELPPVGTQVKGVLDWERRYTTMRYHTALHVLCGIIWKEYGAQVTGCQTYGDRARMDFNLPALNRELADEIEKKVNASIAKHAPVEISILPREVAFQIPDLIRTKVNLLPEEIQEIRVVDIKGIDLQADGGPHVGNTCEIGKVRIGKIDNKGKGNKRIEIILEELENQQK